MITVRFPNGQAIRYNDLHWVAFQSDGTALLKKSEEAFLRPCDVSNPLLSPNESIDIVLANLRSFPGDKLKKLKARLADFDGRTYRWKD